ncbi:hypothetical protein CCP3SC1_320024 [Gammaproteobacteria bacterium]
MVLSLTIYVGRNDEEMHQYRALLKRILVYRFASLPVWALDRLDKANVIELKVWMDIALDAPDLKSIFSS